MNVERQNVNLPEVAPVVNLPPHLARVLEIICLRGTKGITSYEIAKAEGIANLSPLIAKLEDYGAIFEKRKDSVSDEQGKLKTNLTRYIFKGWLGEIDFREEYQYPVCGGQHELH